MKRKIKITVQQLRMILSSEKPKFPMILKGLSKEEFAEISQMLKKKK